MRRKAAVPGPVQRAKLLCVVPQRTFEYLQVVRTEASKSKKWYSGQP